MNMSVLFLCAASSLTLYGMEEDKPKAPRPTKSAGSQLFATLTRKKPRKQIDKETDTKERIDSLEEKSDDSYVLDETTLTPANTPSHSLENLKETSSEDLCAMVNALNLGELNQEIKSSDSKLSKKFKKMQKDNPERYARLTQLTFEIAELQKKSADSTASTTLNTKETL